jgi:hypothetical protein
MTQEKTANPFHHLPMDQKNKKQWCQDGHLVRGGHDGVLDLWPRLGAKTGQLFRLLSHNPPCQLSMAK